MYRSSAIAARAAIASGHAPPRPHMPCRRADALQGRIHPISVREHAHVKAGDAVPLPRRRWRAHKIRRSSCALCGRARPGPCARSRIRPHHIGALPRCGRPCRCHVAAVAVVRLARTPPYLSRDSVAIDVRSMGGGGWDIAQATLRLPYRLGTWCASAQDITRMGSCPPYRSPSTPSRGELVTRETETRQFLLSFRVCFSAKPCHGKIWKLSKRCRCR